MSGKNSVATKKRTQEKKSTGTARPRSEDDQKPMCPVFYGGGSGSEQVPGDRALDSEAIEMEEEEVETPRVMKDPGPPTKEEWDSHCIAHLPPREW